MKHIERARSSSLFLLELIIAILFFSIASAVCVQVFVKSHLLSKEASQINHAVNVSSSAMQVIDHASSYDMVLSDLEESFGNTSQVYYDEVWTLCPSANASYAMNILLEEEGTMLKGDIQVIDLSDDSSIYSIPVAHHLQANLQEGGDAHE